MDLFFYREPEEAEKEEQAAKEYKETNPLKGEVVAHEPVDADWNAGDAQHWQEEATPAVPAVVPPAYNPNEDWAAEVQENWNANPTPAGQTNWATTSDWR